MRFQLFTLKNHRGGSVLWKAILVLGVSGMSCLAVTRVCSLSLGDVRQIALTELAGRWAGGSVDGSGGGAGLDPAEDGLSAVPAVGSATSSLWGFLPVIVKGDQLPLWDRKQKNNLMSQLFLQTLRQPQCMKLNKETPQLLYKNNVDLLDVNTTW